METPKPELETKIDEPEMMISPSRINMDSFFKVTQKLTLSNDKFRPILKMGKPQDLFKKSKTVSSGIDFTQANKRMIIYVDSFSTIRSSESPMAKIIRSSSSTRSSGYLKTTPTPKSKSTSPFSVELTRTLSFFKSNTEKYKPLLLKDPGSTQRMISTEILEVGLGDENPDLAFLTSVNIKERPPINKTTNQKELSMINKVEEDGLQSMLPEIANINLESPSPQELKTGEFSSERDQKLKKARSLQLIKSYRSTMPLPSISEEKHMRIKKQKPKIYISAKANSVQPTGMPKSKKEHLIRVLNKEGTPVAPKGAKVSFPPKKDRIKGMMQVYLSNYDLTKFSYNSSGYYDVLYNRVKNHENNGEPEKPNEAAA